MDKNQTIEKLWFGFLNEWDDKFEETKNTLDSLVKNPDHFSALDLFNFYDSNTIISGQKEWLWLHYRLSNVLEVDFFKPYWIPLSKDSLFHFIDLSSDNFCLFEACYFWEKPYKWYQRVFYDDLQQLLQNISIPLVLPEKDGEKYSFEDRRILEFIKERELLAFSGQLEVKPVKYEELCNKADTTIKEELEITDYGLFIRGINSLACGLLPYDLEISVESLEFRYGKPYLGIQK